MMTEKPYYQKTGFELYHTDSLKFMKELEVNSIDMIFADPPYFLSSGTFICQNGILRQVMEVDSRQK